MKLALLGFGFCTVACALYCVNFLGAVSALSQVHTWPTNGGKMAGAYILVGEEPSHYAMLSLVVGVVFIGVSLFSRRRPPPPPTQVGKAFRSRP